MTRQEKSHANYVKELLAEIDALEAEKQELAEKLWAEVRYQSEQRLGILKELYQLRWRVTKLRKAGQELVDILDDLDARAKIDGFTSQPMKQALAADDDEEKM